MPNSSAHSRPAEPHSVPFTMGAIVLIVSMVGLSATYVLTSLLPRPQWPELPRMDGPRIERTLVGKKLSIPASWLRDNAPADEGFASSVDLELTLPLGKAAALSPIEVTLLPLSQVRPSANLLDGVYLHAFMPDQLSGPSGLIGKPLDGTDGFQDETVWYDPLSPNPFVAKCSSPPAGQTGPARCLRTVGLTGGIAAVYGFSADVLDNWRQFDPELKSWLGRIGAN
ncbi:MAG TPA: hypothetical protein VL418_15090 [Devosiaceae bacterium]|jgi:hypothetical protein|nr:hypothetical protein [Devosiaceae bacterium]